MSLCQHVDQQGKGPLRCYCREFLLGLQNSDSPIPTLDFPSELYKDGDNVKDRKRKERKERRSEKKTKESKNPPTPSIHHSVERQIAQTQGP